MKKFLLTVLVIMCICALIICTDYAGSVTRRRIDGSRGAVVTAEELSDFFFGAIENYSDVLY